MSSAHRRRSEAGFVSVEFMVAVGLSFVFLVMLTNFVVVQYGRGVLRAAADEGARAGSRVVTNPLDVCSARQEDVLDGIGQMASNVTKNCVLIDNGNQIQATVSAKFSGWLPGIPDFDEKAVAVSLKEQAPK